MTMEPLIVEINCAMPADYKSEHALVVNEGLTTYHMHIRGKWLKYWQDGPTPDGRTQSMAMDWMLEETTRVRAPYEYPV